VNTQNHRTHCTIGSFTSINSFYDYYFCIFLDFSYTNWVTDQGLDVLTPLSTSTADRLLEDLGIAATNVGFIAFKIFPVVILRKLQIKT
jgi:hypothetical protein